MKRYSLKYCHSKPYESDEGELVYYKDHVEAIETERNLRGSMRKQTSIWADITTNYHEETITLLKSQIESLQIESRNAKDRIDYINTEINRHRNIAIFSLIGMISVAAIEIIIKI